MPSDFDKLPKTRQGVRDLNSVGTPVRQTLRWRHTCPPHIPADVWGTNEYGDRVLRCRVCHEVLDTHVDDWL